MVTVVFVHRDLRVNDASTATHARPIRAKTVVNVNRRASRAASDASVRLASWDVCAKIVIRASTMDLAVLTDDAWQLLMETPNASVSLAILVLLVK